MNRRRQMAYVTWTIMLLNVIYFLFLDIFGSSEDASYMLQPT